MGCILAEAHASVHHPRLTLRKPECYGGGNDPSRFGLLCMLCLPGAPPVGSLFGVTVRPNANVHEDPGRQRFGVFDFFLASSSGRPDVAASLPERSVDVAIVGAGPTGLTLANLLGRAGVRTVLIEKNDALSGIPKALNVDDEFFRLLQTIGLGDALRAHGVYPVAFDWYSPLGFRIGHNEGRDTHHNFPNRTATFQPIFERILLDGVLAQPAVDVRFGIEVTGFDEHTGGVNVHLRDASGNESSLEAGYIVGADGSHSVVRKQLDIPFDELVRFAQRHLVVDVADDPNTSKTAALRVRWDRTASSLPAPGGRRYEFSLLPEETAEDVVSDAFVAKLMQPFRPFDDLKIIRRAVYSFHSRVARRLQQGRAFLAGDAAHVMPPFGSQGMNSGARDANNLAWKLALVVRGGADPAILSTYHDERHPQVTETIKVATAQGKLRHSNSAPLAAARDLALGAAMLLPPLRRYVAEMRYIPKPALRNGIVVDPVDDHRSAVGRVLPNPFVLVGEIRERLDDTVGPGWIVLGIEDAGGTLPPEPDRDAIALLDAAVFTIGRRNGDGAHRSETRIVDDARFDDVFATHGGRWLIVRPDRIVAAVAKPSALPATASQLASLLGLQRTPVTA
jgi:3-(3-hydroxy-phenyl)propionate hydroxylase